MSGEPATHRSAFDRLRQLTCVVDPPQGATPSYLHMGVTRPVPSPRALPALGPVEDWEAYPTLGGPASLVRAYRSWLVRRFGGGVGGGPLGAVAVEPTPGSKQGVALAIAVALQGRGGRAGGAVVLPDPGYPAYAAAAAGFGGHAVRYDSTAPGVDAALGALAATSGGCAAVVLCNPGNPVGHALAAEDIRRVAAAASEAGALLLIDECYVDLGIAEPVQGALAVAAQGIEQLGRFVVLHSLSKRSGYAGLRSGFAAGDPATVGRLAHLNRQCGVSTPAPVAAVAAQLWEDDDRIAAMRSALRRSWAVADDQLGRVPGYRRPDAGVFAWIPVGDDEAFARRLWEEEAVLVMPGRYLCVDPEAASCVGAGFARVSVGSLAAEPPDVLARLADCALRGMQHAVA